jgi:deazaflavin-dependent oxidoreductase (nitroreductase family)
MTGVVPSNINPFTNQPSLTYFQKIYLWIHNRLMQRLVPLTGPGPVLKWVFKIPVLLYHFGLGRFIGRHILILMTTGRRTGKTRRTPVEYAYDSDRDIYTVMAGWGGHTDWVRNLRIDNHLKVYARGKEFFAQAVPMTDEEVAHYMLQAAGLNPGALAIFSRWANHPLEATLESLQPAASIFPSFMIKPIQSH